MAQTDPEQRVSATGLLTSWVSRHLPPASSALVANRRAGAGERGQGGRWLEDLQTGSSQSRKMLQRERSWAEADPSGVVEGRALLEGPGAREVKGERLQKRMVPREAGRMLPILRAHYRKPKNQCLRHRLCLPTLKTKTVLWEGTLRVKEKQEHNHKALQR